MIRCKYIKYKYNIRSHGKPQPSSIQMFFVFFFQDMDVCCWGYLCSPVLSCCNFYYHNVLQRFVFAIVCVEIMNFHRLRGLGVSNSTLAILALHKYGLKFVSRSPMVRRLGFYGVIIDWMEELSKNWVFHCLELLTLPGIDTTLGFPEPLCECICMSQEAACCLTKVRPC